MEGYGKRRALVFTTCCFGGYLDASYLSKGGGERGRERKGGRMEREGGREGVRRGKEKDDWGKNLEREGVGEVGGRMWDEIRCPVSKTHF